MKVFKCDSPPPWFLQADNLLEKGERKKEKKKYVTNIPFQAMCLTREDKMDLLIKSNHENCFIFKLFRLISVLKEALWSIV